MILKKQTVEGFINQNKLDETNSCKINYQLIQKFEDFINDDFNVIKICEDVDKTGYYVNTASFLLYVKEALTCIGNQLSMSYITSIFNRDYLSKIGEDLNVSLNRLFDHYCDKLLNVRLFDLDYFVNRVFYFCDLPHPKNKLGLSKPQENKIRMNVLTSVMKNESFYKYNLKTIKSTIEKIENKVFPTIETNPSIDITGDIKYKWLKRFEKTMIRNNDQIFVSIKNVLSFALNNFTEINPHIIKCVTEFFDSFMDIVMENFIGADYILCYDHVTQEKS